MQPTASILTATWENLTVEYGRLETVGEFDFVMPKDTISVAFMPHDRVVWSIDGGERKTTPLPSGSVFIYGGRELVWHQREKISEYVNLKLNPQLLEQVAHENNLAESIILDHRVIFQDPTILHVAQLLKEEVAHGGLASALLVESLRNLLAVHLLRNYQGKPAQPQVQQTALDSLKIKQIKDYIEDNIAEELAIAELAALVPMSQFHFARAFKATVGQSPHQYVVKRRMERAKVLLSVTGLPVAEVAYRVGFANQSHFTAQFRKIIGITPKQYRDRSF
jgi:AraC family transcriptional regulator